MPSIKIFWWKRQKKKTRKNRVSKLQATITAWAEGELRQLKWAGLIVEGFSIEYENGVYAITVATADPEQEQGGAFGRTVGELERDLSYDELLEWQAYDRLDPIGGFRQDLQTAHLLYAYYRSMGGDDSSELRDFLPIDPIR